MAIFDISRVVVYRCLELVDIWKVLYVIRGSKLVIPLNEVQFSLLVDHFLAYFLFCCHSKYTQIGRIKVVHLCLELVAKSTSIRYAHSDCCKQDENVLSCRETGICAHRLIWMLWGFIVEKYCITYEVRRE